MREQIAQQPPSRSGGRTAQDVPPPWISQLDTRILNRSNTKPEPAKQQQRQPPVDVPAPEPAPPEQRGNPSGRALHVKVWDEAEIDADTPPEHKSSDDVSEDDGFEMLPTRPLAASVPGAPAPLNGNAAPPASSRPAPDTHIDEIEHLDTVPLATPSRSRQTPWPSAGAYTPPQQRAPQSDLFAAERTQAANPASPFPYAPPAPAASRPEQQRGASPQPASQPGLGRQVAAPPVMPARAKPANRKRLLVVTLVVLAALVVAGAVAFVIVKQPFSVPSVTQTRQTFSNTQLGFSLQYPNGWLSSANAAKGTAAFYDTSRTAQFNVLVSTNASNPSQYLQQEASKLGMTNLQTNLPPLSFGGASWQQIKGNVLLSGASYTETVFVAVHGNSLFTVMQLAPQTTYTQEEQIAFSSMRSSFQFL